MTSDTDRIAALEKRLLLLEDKEEIRHLRDSYHACINDGRFGEIVDLFTDDAFVRLGYLAEYRGQDAINAGFCGMGERERFFIKQYIHSHRIFVDGDCGVSTTVVIRCSPPTREEHLQSIIEVFD